MKILLLPVATSFLMTSFSTASTAQSLDIDLRDTTSWRTVVDGVMGGRSTGRVSASQNGALAFSGELSLANNGGFSQIRTDVDGEQLAGATGFALECRGDGRTYKFDVRVSNARVRAGGFQAEFDTVAGEWSEVRLPLEAFRLFSFGRQVRSAPELDPSKIESLGVTLADKKEGEFRLEIRSIEAIGAPRDDDELASVAEAAGLTTLLECLEAAELELPDSAVTVFAPTNEAFAALPPATLKELLRPESRDELRRILALHVVPGRLAAGELFGSTAPINLAGESLVVSVKGGRVAVGGTATMVASDVEAGESIVHVIDRVLLPPAPEPTSAPAPRKTGAEATVAVCEAAVSRGAPLFNAGELEACAAVYEMAIDSMILLGGNGLDEDLAEDILERLEESRREAEEASTTSRRCWTLRRGLNDVYRMTRRSIERGRDEELVGAR